MKRGREALEEIRLINPSVKALFVSGYAEDIVSRYGLLEPGINFLLKPLSPSALLKKLREILNALTEAAMQSNPCLRPAHFALFSADP